MKKQLLTAICAFALLVSCRTQAMFRRAACLARRGTGRMIDQRTYKAEKQEDKELMFDLKMIELRINTLNAIPNIPVKYRFKFIDDLEDVYRSRHVISPRPIKGIQFRQATPDESNPLA